VSTQIDDTSSNGQITVRCDSYGDLVEFVCGARIIFDRSGLAKDEHMQALREFTATGLLPAYEQSPQDRARELEQAFAAAGRALDRALTR
jgi:hypothetical protein